MQAKSVHIGMVCTRGCSIGNKMMPGCKQRGVHIGVALAATSVAEEGVEAAGSGWSPSEPGLHVHSTWLQQVSYVMKQLLVGLCVAAALLTFFLAL
jgi:hypothetical protein